MRIMLSTVHAQKHNRQNFEYNRVGLVNVTQMLYLVNQEK